MRILFPYIAQPHQTLHSLPIAMEIASRHPEAEVHLACTTQSHLDYVRSLAAYYPESKVQFSLLHLPQFLRRQTERYGQTAFFVWRAYFLTRIISLRFRGS